MENKRKYFAPGTLTAPVPPAIVTVGDFDNANMLTVAWTGILASTPPKTYISVRPSRHSYSMLKEKGEFVVNLPSVAIAKEVDFVGIYTGAKMDKFEKTGLTKQRSEKVAPPTIAECPVALECRVCDIQPMGSHDVFVADILNVSCSENIIDEDGKMRFDKADLLAYAHGEYYALGDVIGRFGFSTDKAKKSDKTKKNSEKMAENRKKETKAAPTHKPFYESAPRSKQAKKRPTDKNKGAPHGKRRTAK